MSARRTTAYYPVCLSLEGRPVLVVGGGPVAEQKVRTLLRYGAQVIVVAPALTPRLRRWARTQAVTHRRRAFRASDVNRGCALVYAATDDARVQQVVCRIARRLRVPVNVVDVPALCTFTSPAQIRRGGLTVAITTGGRAPGLAKRVRRDIARVIGPEYGALLRVLERVRPIVRRRVPTMAGRRRALERLIYSGWLQDYRQGRRRAAQQQVRRWLRTLTARER